jgi:hypothetical protein
MKILEPEQITLIQRHRQAIKELYRLEIMVTESPEDELCKKYLIAAQKLLLEGIRQEAKERVPQLAEKGFFNTFKEWYLKPFRREEIKIVQTIQESGRWTCPDGYDVELDEHGIVRRVTN